MCQQARVAHAKLKPRDGVSDEILAEIAATRLPLCLHVRYVVACCEFCCIVAQEAIRVELLKKNGDLEAATALMASWAF